MTPLPRLYSRRTLLRLLTLSGIRNAKVILLGLQKATYQGRTLYVWPEVQS